MAAPAPHPCAICGSAAAPYGLRLPGLRSQLPAGRAGYLWTCADHRAEAETRRDGATRIAPPAAAPAQPGLFDQM